MLNNDITCPMKKNVTKIVNAVKQKTHVYQISMLFTSPRFPSLKVNLCREIDRLTIHQDYAKNITDKITCELTLDRDPYVTLYYLRKDLRCEMTMTPMFPDKTDASAGCGSRQNQNEDVFNFQAMLTKYEDIFEKVSVDRIWPEFNKKRDETDRDRATYKMTIELISEDVYKARKAVLNEIFTNKVKMIDILRFTCNVFGFSSACIMPPDNEWKYINFVIPPSYGVESIMSYLQNAPGLGVYNDGFCSYITRWWKKLDKNSWYIWPRYGPRLVKNPIHVYSVGGNMYTGLNQNHYVDGAGVNILVTDDLDFDNRSDLDSENEITGINYQCSQTLLDGSRFLKADDDVKAKSVASDYVNVPSDTIDMKNFVRVKYVQNYGNTFRLRSLCRPPQQTWIKFKWLHAAPWTFTPCTEVQLHYDHPLGFKTYKGKCETATYTITRDQTQAVFPHWVCAAEIMLCCDNIIEKDGGKKAHE